MLGLSFNLAQEANLETLLSAAFPLKHAANMQKTFASTKGALDRASQRLPRGTPSDGHVHETPSGRFKAHIDGKFIKPQSSSNLMQQLLFKYSRLNKEVQRFRV